MSDPRRIKANTETYEDVYDLKALNRLGQPLEGCLSLCTVNGKRGTRVSLENWYRGKSIFLLGGGPSLADMDLQGLRRPGVTTLGVNNVWAVFRPSLWICIDRPANFLPTGWKDPSIIKFAPAGKIDDYLHEKQPDGKFKVSTTTLRDMPSVFYFPRNEIFQPKQFFSERTINWGCHKNAKDPFGHTGSRSVMLAALRLSVYLGFKRIYIIGADFKMKDSPQRAPVRNYAWEQWRHESSVRGNNKTYRVLNKRLASLLPGLKRREV